MPIIMPGTLCMELLSQKSNGFIDNLIIAHRVNYTKLLGWYVTDDKITLRNVRATKFKKSLINYLEIIGTAGRT